MSIDSINNYGTGGVSGASNATSRTTGKNTLDMDDFFKLMVAQLSNQDMYNTVDDSQFMAQMAQFSMVQALADLSELSFTAYGVSLIGKEVTVAQIADNGTVASAKGIVDSVNFYNGGTQVVVDGKSYSLSSIMSVKEPDIIIPGGDINGGSDPEAGDGEDPADGANNDGSPVNGAEGSGSADGSDGSDAGDEAGGTEGGGDV